jgi:hypothetical protein
MVVKKKVIVKSLNSKVPIATVSIGTVTVELTADEMVDLISSLSQILADIGIDW